MRFYLSILFCIYFKIIFILFYLLLIFRIYGNFTLDASPLGRTAAVVRNRCYVADADYLKTTCGKSPDCSFTPWSGAFYKHVYRLQSMYQSSLCSCFCRHLRIFCERSRPEEAQNICGQYEAFLDLWGYEKAAVYGTIYLWKNKWHPYVQSC